VRRSGFYRGSGGYGGHKDVWKVSGDQKKTQVLKKTKNKMGENKESSGAATSGYEECNHMTQKKRKVPRSKGVGGGQGTLKRNG